MTCTDAIINIVLIHKPFVLLLYSVSEANPVKMCMMCVRVEHKTASLRWHGGTKGTVKEAGTTQGNQLSAGQSETFQICS